MKIIIFFLLVLTVGRSSVTLAEESEKTTENVVHLFRSNSPDYFRNLHALHQLFNHEFWMWPAFSKSVTSSCADDMKEYLDKLRLGNPLAIQISDASGRYGGGALMSNVFWVGSKTLCEDVNVELVSSNVNVSRMHFSVNRVMIRAEPLFSLVNIIYVGQCLPENCDKDDVKVILENDPAVLEYWRDAVPRNGTVASNELKVLDVRMVPGTYSLFDDPKFYLFCAIAGLLIVLVLYATIYEIYLKMSGYDIRPMTLVFDANGVVPSNEIKKTVANIPDTFDLKSPHNGLSNGNGTYPNILKPVSDEPKQKPLCFWSKFVLCFAVGSNAKTIFNLDPAKEKSFSCIHGLRMFSLIWTILGHTCLMMFAIGANQIAQAREAKKFYFQIVVNGTYAVDTFFFMSGFLVVSLFLRTYKAVTAGNNKELEAKMKSPWQWVSKTVLLIVYRYGRLTPVYMLVMLFSEIGMRHTYNRSVFPNNPDLVDHLTCEKYWWRNVLYINNWFPKDEICVIWSWFLANEMQFYVMAILLLVISLKHFKTAMFFLISFLLSSWVISACISVAHDYKYKLILPLEAFDYLYEKPWNRVGAYIIGMITGGIFDHYRTPPKVSRSLNLFLWFVSIAVLFGMVFGFWIQEMPVGLTAFVVSIGRSAWSAALIWIMLSCCWGLAPPINNFLSYKAWIPFSRLTYCAYLIHPLLMALLYHQLETPVPLRDVLVLAIYFGSTVLTFSVALIFSLALEAPMIRVMRLLIQK